MAQLVKNLPARQETWSQSLGCNDPLEQGKGYPTGLENSMDCTVHQVTKSWTQLSDFQFQRDRKIIIPIFLTCRCTSSITGSANLSTTDILGCIHLWCKVGGGAILCIVVCLAASLASSQEMPGTSHPHKDIQKYLQTLLNVPQGIQNCPWLRTPDLCIEEKCEFI